ncbi:MAG: hypothetical protein M3065_04635 [Actinomycetota bacterium]|nr:hypothetical protein [Actinomycetota bacterium]
MPSLYCSRCGFRTKLTPALLVLENCPRCVVWSGTASPLVVTPPAETDRAEAPRAARQTTSPPARF